MAADVGLVAWVEEAMAPLGQVTGRAMMGGRTLYHDGTVFAIVAEDQLWFKADAVSDAWWDEAGAERFTYSMRLLKKGTDAKSEDVQPAAGERVITYPVNPQNRPRRAEKMISACAAPFHPDGKIAIDSAAATPAKISAAQIPDSQFGRMFVR